MCAFFSVQQVRESPPHPFLSERLTQSPGIFADCSRVYAIEAASLHPAKCLGIERQKGTLDFDSDADFILLDNQLQLLSTWIGGVCVHRSAN